MRYSDGRKNNLLICIDNYERICRIILTTSALMRSSRATATTHPVNSVIVSPAVIFFTRQFLLRSFHFTKWQQKETFVIHWHIPSGFFILEASDGASAYPASRTFCQDRADNKQLLSPKFYKQQLGSVHRFLDTNPTDSTHQKMGGRLKEIPTPDIPIHTKDTGQVIITAPPLMLPICTSAFPQKSLIIIQATSQSQIQVPLHSSHPVQIHGF